MRLDHIAYRVADRHKTVEFFKSAFGYTVQTEFTIDFEDGSKTKCFALEPPEKPSFENHKLNWVHWQHDPFIEYHLAPEIFVSDGDPNSIVGKWVAARQGIGGIHHLAYQVNSVEKTMKEWKDLGYAEFTSEKPLECPDLKQCFTKPSLLTGVIYEFIERGAHGFCASNVKNLMESTKDVDLAQRIQIDAVTP